MAMILALDTNAYSDFRRVGKWSSAVAAAASVVIPFVVLAELRSGFALGAQTEKNLVALREFLEADIVQLVYADVDTTVHYAELFLQLRRAGRPIPTNDIWIAALCVQHGFVLATGDQHFHQMRQLSLAVDAGS
ncbi:MAG: PIN domain-containing protein [Puniceicoccales bacterium]